MIESIVPALIIILSLIGVKRRKADDLSFLSLEQGNALKGVAALLLVIVHIRERLAIVPAAYKALAAGGYLLVAIFFFYSGYGITKKGTKEASYITARLPKRILYLIELILISETIYYGANVLLFGREFDYLDFLKCIFGITMLNGAMWTVVAMLIIQIVIFIGRKIFKNMKLSYLAAAGCLIYILITALRGRGAWEMQSCLAFYMGAVIAEHEDYVADSLHKCIPVIFAAVIFVVSFSVPYAIEHFTGTDNKLLRVVAGSIASITFLYCVLWLVSKIRIQNKAIVFLGTMFTEIYIWHGLILDLMKLCMPVLFEKESLYIFTSVFMIIIVVLFSFILKKLGTFDYHKLFRSKNSET